MHIGAIVAILDYALSRALEALGQGGACFQIFKQNLQMIPFYLPQPERLVLYDSASLRPMPLSQFHQGLDHIQHCIHFFFIELTHFYQKEKNFFF